MAVTGAGVIAVGGSCGTTSDFGACGDVRTLVFWPGGGSAVVYVSGVVVGGGIGGSSGQGAGRFSRNRAAAPLQALSTSVPCARCGVSAVHRACGGAVGTQRDECFLFFSSRRRHSRCSRDWSSDVCSSD